MSATRQSTFTAAKSWVKELEKQLPQGVVLTLCGNKTDLSNLREVSSKVRPLPTCAQRELAEFDARCSEVACSLPQRPQEAQAYAKEHGMLFSEASARKGTGVNEMFLSIGTTNYVVLAQGYPID